MEVHFLPHCYRNPNLSCLYYETFLPENTKTISLNYQRFFQINYVQGHFIGFCFGYTFRQNGLCPFKILELGEVKLSGQLTAHPIHSQPREVGQCDAGAAVLRRWPKIWQSFARLSFITGIVYLPSLQLPIIQNFLRYKILILYYIYFLSTYLNILFNRIQYGRTLHSGGHQLICQENLPQVN